MRRRIRDRDTADSAAGAALERALRLYDGSTPWQAYLLHGLAIAARDELLREPKRLPARHAWQSSDTDIVDARLDWETLTRGMRLETKRVMHAWGVGYSFVEIGALLGISKSKAHVEFYRGVAFVKGKAACQSTTSP